MFNQEQIAAIAAAMSVLQQSMRSSSPTSLATATAAAATNHIHHDGHHLNRNHLHRNHLHENHHHHNHLHENHHNQLAAEQQNNLGGLQSVNGLRALAQLEWQQQQQQQQALIDHYANQLQRADLNLAPTPPAKSLHLHHHNQQQQQHNHHHQQQQQQQLQQQQQQQQQQQAALLNHYHQQLQQQQQSTDLHLDLAPSPPKHHQQQTLIDHHYQVQFQQQLQQQQQLQNQQQSDLNLAPSPPKPLHQLQQLQPQPQPQLSQPQPQQVLPNTNNIIITTNPASKPPTRPVSYSAIVAKSAINSSQSTTTPSPGSATNLLGFMGLYVGNLSPDLTKEQLEKIFSKYGEPVKAHRLIRSPVAFIKYENTESPRAAIDDLYGLLLPELTLNQDQPLKLHFDRNDAQLKANYRPTELPPKSDNGECYSWRTTVCRKGKNCPKKHIPINRGIDFQMWMIKSTPTS